MGWEVLRPRNLDGRPSGHSIAPSNGGRDEKKQTARAPFGELLACKENRERTRAPPKKAPRAGAAGRSYFGPSFSGWPERRQERNRVPTALGKGDFPDK